MSTRANPLVEVRDLKVHFPSHRDRVFGPRKMLKAVDGVDRAAVGAPAGAGALDDDAHVVAAAVEPVRGFEHAHDPAPEAGRFE